MPNVSPPAIVSEVVGWVQASLAVLYPTHDFEIEPSRSPQGVWRVRATLSHAAYDDLRTPEMSALRNAFERCVAEFGRLHSPRMLLQLRRRT